MSQSVIDRRTFLKAVGLTAAGTVGATRVLGSESVPSKVLPMGASAADTGYLTEIERFAAALDYDPTRIFRFVADEIRYEPYTGLLRGAVGTLASRAGNSVDQASLLGALLDASYVRSRLVTGPIDASVGEAILARAVLDQEGAQGEIQTVLGGMAPGDAPSDDPGIRDETRFQEALLAAPDTTAWAAERLTADVDRIGEALESAGVSLDATFTSMPAEELERHVWIQMGSGSEWVDLDPTLPGGAPGTVMAGAVRPLGPIPDELRHVVTIAVVAETMTGGMLREERILEVSAEAWELLDRPVAFLNIPPGDLASLGLSVSGGLAGRTNYLACLAVGDEVATSSVPIGFANGEGTDDVFGGDPESIEGDTSAQWIDVTITSPGHAPATARRAVFDRVGPAARATDPPDLSAVRRVELASLADGLPLHFVPALSQYWLTVMPGPLGGRTLASALPAEETLTSMGSTVFAHDIVRMAAVADVGMPFGVRTFVDRPAVTALSSRVTPGTGGTAVLETAVDLLHRPQGRVAVRGVVAPGRPALVPGVLTHVVERLVAGEHTPESARASSVVSVGALFERAAAEGVPLVVLRRPADVDGLGYPADAAARLRTALVDGVVAVVPGRAIAIGGSPRVGWWLVDVGTGEVRDQMDDGRGVSGLEDTVPIRVITVASAPSYLKLGLCMAFAAVATAYIIFLVSTATSDSVSGGDVVAAGLGGAGTSVLGAACAIA